MLGLLANNASLKKNETFNSCGKVVFQITPLDMLKRFMFLGTEKGTYYTSANNLTEQQLQSLDDLLAGDVANHEKIIDLVKEYSVKAFKVDYVLYVLARCCAEKNNPDMRKKCYALLKDVCRTPTNMFMFIQMYEIVHKKLHGTTGWNALQKATIADWYLSKNTRDLVYLITKYKNRNGWTHTDALRLSHAKPKTFNQDCVFKYITKGLEEFLAKLAGGNDAAEDREWVKDYLSDYEELSKGTLTAQQAIEYIQRHNFVREHVPTTLLNDADVWNALLTKMPMVAMLRNLNKITAIDVFEKYPATLERITSALKSKEVIEKSKAHPMQFLIALKMYAKGHGDKGKLTWTPNHDITAALNEAFKHSFKNVVPTNKRYLLALDVSGSMTSSTVCGVECLTACEVSAAMSMIIAAAEPCCDVMGFAYQFKPLNVRHDRPLQDNLREVQDNNFGSTDCSLPMTWALQNEKAYDAMIVFTDNETNMHRMRPVDALRKYNTTMGLNCKLIVVATSVSNFTIADPEDPNMLDICGFDASTPLCISEFVGPSPPPPPSDLIKTAEELVTYIQKGYETDASYGQKIVAKKQDLKNLYGQIQDFPNIDGLKSVIALMI